MKVSAAVIGRKWYLLTKKDEEEDEFCRKEIVRLLFKVLFGKEGKLDSDEPFKFLGDSSLEKENIAAEAEPTKRIISLIAGM